MSLRYRAISAALLLSLCVVALAATSASALDQYAVPSLSCVGSTQTTITLKVTAGCSTGAGSISGAPAGVSIHWMTAADYANYGWLDSSDPRMCALSLSGQPSLSGNAGDVPWSLPSCNSSFEITIGGSHIFDETGVGVSSSCTNDLLCGTTYVFRVFAHATSHVKRSDFSGNTSCTTADCDNESCTFTQGYWKTHGPAGCVTGNNSNEWPVSSLTLGTVGYTDLQLCSIMNTPAAGNGLLSLAHQLIAAKLNIANGVTCSSVSSAIAAADALIGSLVAPPVGGGSLSNSSTSGLTATLTNFNEGNSGCATHCGSAVPGAPTPSTWGTIKSIYR